MRNIREASFIKSLTSIFIRDYFKDFVCYLCIVLVLVIGI